MMIWWRAFCQWRWRRALAAADLALDAADRWKRRSVAWPRIYVR
jgi:hypothetical protein